MDPDTVIAVGSLIHDLLGLVGGIILCYFGYRLMMRRIRAYPADGKWSWNAAKILFKNTAPGTIFALLGAIAIWLTAAKGLHSDGSRSFADTSNASNPAVSELSDDHPIVMTLGSGSPGPIQGSQNPVPEDPFDRAATSGAVTVGAPDVAKSLKMTPAKKLGDVVVAASETAKGRQQEADPRMNGSGKTGPKILEKQRLAAERKRSRLEAMYQKGIISSEAYKSGEDEYRIAIQRYRSEVNAARVDEN